MGGDVGGGRRRVQVQKMGTAFEIETSNLTFVCVESVSCLVVSDCFQPHEL